MRQASVTVPSGGNPENGFYSTAAVQKNCDSDEKAISAGTGWSVDINDDELWTGYLAPVLNPQGAVIGFRARGGNDTGVAREFTVFVLCYKG